MLILLQEEPFLDLDGQIVQEVIDRSNGVHVCYHETTARFARVAEGKAYPQETIRWGIPVGSLQFVETWLKAYWNIDHINPIEVPPCLRTDEFLKRDYRIVPFADIPKSGQVFLKDASRLKQFGRVVYLDRENIEDGLWNPYAEGTGDQNIHLDQSHLYQVSEVVPIDTEYRVYVQDDTIQAVAHYNGDPCIFPDIHLVKKMIGMYASQQDRPGAYTMDVAVNRTGTFLLEVHPWVSVGLYTTVWGTNLLYAYRDGIQWVKDFNTEPAPYRQEG